MKITKQIHPININIEEFIKEHLPNTFEFYKSTEELHKDINYLFEYHLGKTKDRDVYAISTDASIKLVQESTDYYRFMLAAARELFSKNFKDIQQFYPGMESHKLELLWDIAKHTFNYHGIGSAIYGRFDMAVNPVTGELKGFYEFNGDTPCLLFESVNLQHQIASMVTDPHNQENSWWDCALETGKRFEGKTVALACYTQSIEDIVNTETLSQVINECGGTAIMVDIRDLHHDVLNKSKPFFVTDNHIIPDYIYSLMPWEEMVDNGYHILKDWRHWVDTQRFMEPAWRWFMSHKGFMVWLTYLLESHPGFERYRALKHIPTYFTNEFGDNYVSKPVTGRMSHNVSIVKNGVVTTSAEGNYSTAPLVYQPYVPPGEVDGNNFIVCGWVSPHSKLDENYVTTLCIREFDNEVLDVQNERFVPHILV